MTAADPLFNVIWNSLAGPHATLAEGSSGVRRYRAGFTPFVAFADPERPDFAAWRALAAPGESLSSFFWTGDAPSGWTIARELPLLQMVWDAPAPRDDPAFHAAPLVAAYVPQVMALTDLTRPGPFGPRTIEMGEYFGVFEGERLVAMAGERLHAGAWHEVSGVCTHPDFQGRGLAGRLMTRIIARQHARGQRPFLHVFEDNLGAIALYRKLGFREHRKVLARVVNAD